MLSLNYENINYVMTQILKLSCASFSYVNISYVLADHLVLSLALVCITALRSYHSYSWTNFTTSTNILINDMTASSALGCNAV